MTGQLEFDLGYGVPDVAAPGGPPLLTVRARARRGHAPALSPKQRVWLWRGGRHRRVRDVRIRLAGDLL